MFIIYELQSSGTLRIFITCLYFRKKDSCVTFSLPVSFQEALPLLQDWSFLITHNALTIA